jgi:tetratricopeptide (TPR) repeat protein
MKLPSQGGPAWAEYQSEHFKLQTNMDEPVARRTLGELEERRAGLLQAAWHGVDYKTMPTRVVALRDALELQEFMFQDILGVWMLDSMGEKLMVLAHDSTRGMSVFTHELTHDLSSSYFARQPRWLSEGMARFLETLRIDPKHEKIVIGIPIQTAFKADSLPGLFRAEREGRAVDYEEAWALVFYLENYEGAAFNEYQKALFRGDEPEPAWTASFPAYADDDGLWRLQRKVNDAIGRLGFTGEYKTASARLRRYEGEVRKRVMLEPEIRALRGALFLDLPHSEYQDDARRAEAHEEARRALAQDPSEISAIELMIRLSEDRVERLALARAATQRRPSDFRAWLLVDQALDDANASPEDELLRVSSLEQAVGLAPENPWALQRLGRARARAGQGELAMALVRRSLALFPDSAYALDSMAMAAKVQGDCPAAQQLQRMAVDRLPHVPPDFKAKSKGTTQFLSRLQAIRDRLEVYRTGCSPPKG